MTVPLNILLVDDKPENLVALEELLRHPGRRLFKATSGNEALRLMLRHRFAVVLLDVEMPGMDGYETAQIMRSADQTQLIPIIFVTAGDRSEERTFKGYEAGAVDFLYKPINAFTLTCKVDLFVELYRSAEQLAMANASLRDKVDDLEHVTRTLSHDLRAPLRSIQGFSTALRESLGEALPSDAAGHLRRILRAGDRMSRMIDDLYDLLRLSAAETVVADISVVAVLDGVVDSLRGDLTETGARVTHGELPELRTNKTLLAQILQNLIANAIKFRGDDPPRVHVEAEQIGDAWQLSVRDNGIGIKPEDRDRVFGLFQRASGETVPGTGVGLALCRRAVAKLGGRIWADATPGGGATFTFTVGAPPPPIAPAAS